MEGQGGVRGGAGPLPRGCPRATSASAASPGSGARGRRPLHLLGGRGLSGMAVAEPVRLGTRLGTCATVIVVDSAGSREAGLTRWGLPKEMGTLHWSSEGEDVSLRWGGARRGGEGSAARAPVPGDRAVAVAAGPHRRPGPLRRPGVGKRSLVPRARRRRARRSVGLPCGAPPWDPPQPGRGANGRRPIVPAVVARP